MDRDDSILFKKLLSQADIRWDAAILMRSVNDVYVWLMPRADSYCYVLALDLPKRYSFHDRGDIKETSVPPDEWLATGSWEIIEPSSALLTHPCADCDKAILVDDYLCSSCRA